MSDATLAELYEVYRVHTAAQFGLRKMRWALLYRRSVAAEIEYRIRCGKDAPRSSR